MSTTRDTIMRKIHGADFWPSINTSGASVGDTQGWCGEHRSLSRLAQADSACVVDVGVWKGQSTITLARALKDAGIDGCVVAVDTFLGSPEHWVGNYTGLFQMLNGRPNLYETFLSNVRDADVEDIVVPFAQTSTTAAAILKALDIRPDLVHIDAAHEYEDVKRDAMLFWEILRPGGHMIGDDYLAHWPGVVKAAGEMSYTFGVPLEIDGPKWIMRKPS